MTADDANALPTPLDELNVPRDRASGASGSSEPLELSQPLESVEPDRLDEVAVAEPPGKSSPEASTQLPTDPTLQPDVEPDVEPENQPKIQPQLPPTQCGVCGALHWELYAHLPIETEAYLAAIAEANCRSRQTKPSRSQATPGAIAEPMAESISELSAEETLHTPPSEFVIQDAPDVVEAPAKGDNQPPVEQPEAVPESVTSDTSLPSAESAETLELTQFPQGTAWRCCGCGALSLVWPIASEPIVEVGAAAARRRSSAEFRDSIQKQIEACTQSPSKTGVAPTRLGRLRVLDLNLGRGTNADRNLALLHELGLGKHQIFAIGDDPNTVDRLNDGGYQAYCGTIHAALAHLPDRHFHVVLGFNALEYLPHPNDTLQQLATKLQPRARLILELANPESWQARLFRHGYWSSYQRDRRILIGETALEVLSRQCHFAIDKIESYTEPQAWETSMAAWARRKRHLLRGIISSGLMRQTLIGLDRVRAALGKATSRYGAVLVFQPPTSGETTDAIEICQAAELEARSESGPESGKKVRSEGGTDI